jgi:hypothetical protein
VLAIVQEKQEPLASEHVHERLGQWLAGLLCDAQDGGHRSRYQGPLMDGCEVDKPHSAWEPRHRSGRELDGEARLADPRRSDQRQEAVCLEKFLQHGQVGLAPDERREPKWQSVRLFESSRRLPRVGKGHGNGDLASRPESKLGQDLLHVPLGGPSLDPEVLGNLVVGQAISNKTGNLSLTVCQPGEIRAHAGAMLSR